MKPLKAHFTDTILFTARTIPWFFPKWLRFISKSYSREEQNSLEHLYEKENKLKTASLLDGDFTWKAVSVVTRIDHKELEAIHNWLKISANPGNYNPNRDANGFSTNYDQSGGYINLGFIQFHREDRLGSLARIELLENVCESCYITISRFSNGIIYLSLYFFLKPEATEKVSGVDVSDIKRYHCFGSINPLSNQFKVIEHHDRRHNIEYLIKKKINSMCSDVRIAAFKLFKLWSIRKKINELILVADIYRDDNVPYFIDRGDKTKFNRSDTEYILIDRNVYPFYDDHISNDKSENYCSTFAVKDTELDVLYIKSKRSDSFDQFDNFSKNGLALYDSHLFLSMFIDVSKQYKKISSYANFALLKNNNNIEDNYDTLLNAGLMLDSLNENIRAISGSIQHSCKNAYIDHAKKIVTYQLNLVNNLKDVIDKRRIHSNNEVQVQNLRFHRRYAYLVGFLVVIQILLAVLTIDWDKTYNNLNSLCNKIFFLSNTKVDSVGINISSKEKNNQHMKADIAKQHR